MGRACIQMDNLVKPGQVTRDEVLAALAAQGVPVKFATPVFDQVSGNLVQVELTNFDITNAVAVDAINKLPGVSEVPLIPDELFVGTLSGITAPALSDNSQITYAYASGDLSCIVEGGLLEPSGFTLLDPNAGCTGSVIDLSMVYPKDGGFSYTINSGELIIVTSTGSIPMVLTNPIVFGDTFGSEQLTLWIDSDGKAYTLGHSQGLTVLVDERDYPTATQFPAL